MWRFEHAALNSFWNSDPLSVKALRREPSRRKNILLRKSAADFELLVVYILAKAIFDVQSIAVRIYLLNPLPYMTMVSRAMRNPGKGCLLSSVTLFLA